MSETHHRLLITAGPTQEPIDAVRYLGNRSSGRLGVALAETAADRGWRVTLLLGETGRTVDHPHVRVVPFRTTADLRAALAEYSPECDALVMAAAVADYTPTAVGPPGDLQPVREDSSGQKIRRVGEKLIIELEPTPDLLAEVVSRRHPGQLMVGFALEPADRLVESAMRKLKKKGVDLIVANPLETMDATVIEAKLIGPEGAVAQTDGAIHKRAFAEWLLEKLEPRIKS